jgi:hypothetical protein
MPQALTDTDIINAIQGDIDAAKAYQQDLSAERERLYAIYRAQPYGNEVEGWSQVVHPTAYSAVEWLKPGLLEIFIGDFFSFSPIKKELPPPVQPPDSPAAASAAPGPFGRPGATSSAPGGLPGRKSSDPASESAKRLKSYIRHKLFNQLDGEQLVDDGIHDALTSHYAIAKVTQREDYDIDVEPLERASTAEIAAMMADDPEIVDIRGGNAVQEFDSTTGYYWEGIEGAEIVRRKVHYQGFYVEIVPPSELYFLPGYSDLQKNPLVAHVVKRDLDYVLRQEMAGVYRPGSRDRVKSKLDQRGDPTETESERLLHSAVDGVLKASDYGEGAVSPNKLRTPGNEVLIWECYCRLDIRGDGLLRPCIVTICENEVLREPIENPYGGPPFELGYVAKEPGKIIGRPVVAVLEQQQKVLTNLLRNIQDSAAKSTYSGWITSDPRSRNALMDFSPASVMMVPDITKIQQIETAAPSQFIFNAFQLSLQETSKEAGVNENMQGLDNNSLNKTAQGMNMRLTAAMMRQKHMARNLARWWRRILRRILDVIRQFPPVDDVRFVGADVALKPEDIEGQYTIDIEVGVGPQDRQQQSGMMRELVQMLIQQFIPNGQATPQQLTKATIAMFEYMDMDVSPYLLPEDEIEPWQMVQKQMGLLRQQMEQMQKELQRRQPQQGNPQEEAARFQLDAQAQRHSQAMDERNFQLDAQSRAAELALEDKKITLDAVKSMQPQPGIPVAGAQTGFSGFPS